MDFNKLSAFIGQIANMNKWTPGDPTSEMEPPTEGVWDSHECLMSLIDEARALQEPLGLLPGWLSRVVDMARAHLHDIEEGLEDGTYNESDNEDVGEKRSALEGIEAYLTGQTLTSRYLVVVEGDVEPFVTGPYCDEDQVLEVARAQRLDDPQGQNGLYWLDIRDGEPQMGTYPSGLLATDLHPFVVAYQSHDPERVPRFRNHYRCVTCAQEWDDTWDSQCDDKCPACGAVMTPYTSEDLGAAVEFFPCEAEDADHALEQAADAYPDATILGAVPSWMNALKRGDGVFWNDENGDAYTGFYLVEDINTGTGRIETLDSAIRLRCDGHPGLISTRAHQIEQVTS